MQSNFGLMQHLHHRILGGTTVRFRDETGMDETPTQRWIMAHGQTSDHWFGNNRSDTDGSTLVHEDCFFVPIRERNSNGTYTSEVTISTYSPDFVPELELGDTIMCYLQPTGTWGDHTRAARWTLTSMWSDAHRNYAILRQYKNGHAQKIAEFAGILDLSAQYGTTAWNNGIIAHHNQTTYYLVQLILDDKGHEFYHPITEDPRLAPDELPREHRGRLVLPQ